MLHQIKWRKKKSSAHFQAEKKKENNTPVSTESFSSNNCNHGMSVLLDIIRYYTVERNNRDIGEITCLTLSQNCYA